MSSVGQDAGKLIFRSTLTSRRFPALRSLTADDVEVMVMPAGTTSSASKKDSSATAALSPTPKVESAPAPPRQKQSMAKPPKPRPPFTPCNPVEAKESITLRNHGYVGIHSPYDLAHRLQMLERDECERRCLAGVFVPNSRAEAKADVKVNYFLNSADAETIEAERRYIKDKANRNMIEFHRRMRQQAPGKAALAGP